MYEMEWRKPFKRYVMYFFIDGKLTEVDSEQASVWPITICIEYECSIEDQRGTTGIAFETDMLNNPKDFE